MQRGPATALNTVNVGDCAVSLSWLLDFARHVPDRASTADVVERVIKPQTAALRCRYVALPTVPPGAVSRSRFFISHHWGCDFVRELVAAVAGSFADQAAAAAATAQQQPAGRDGHVSFAGVPFTSSSQAVEPEARPAAVMPRPTQVTAPCDAESDNAQFLDLGDSGAATGASTVSSPSGVVASFPTQMGSDAQHHSSLPPQPSCSGDAALAPHPPVSRLHSRTTSARAPSPHNTHAGSTPPLFPDPPPSQAASSLLFGPLNPRTSSLRRLDLSATAPSPPAGLGGGVTASSTSLTSRAPSQRHAPTAAGVPVIAAAAAVTAAPSLPGALASDPDGEINAAGGVSHAGTTAVPPFGLRPPAAGGSGRRSRGSAGSGAGGGGAPSDCAAAAATATSAHVSSSCGSSSNSSNSATSASARSNGTGNGSGMTGPAGSAGSMRRGGAEGPGGGGGALPGSNAEVVEQVLCRFREAGALGLLDSTFVWLDIFAINQHADTTQADDLAALQDVVGASAGTLLVLDRSGRALTRIWCLYEIWQTVRRRGPEALRVLGGALEAGELRRVWGELDVGAAQATVEVDRVRILADIRASTGAAELNAHIKRALVESATHELATVRAAAPSSPWLARVALRAARLLGAAGGGGGGAGPATLAAAREAAAAAAACFGSASAQALEALLAVAAAHRDLGSLGTALEVVQGQVLPHVTAAYGADPAPSYGILYDTGMLQYRLGRHGEAYGSLARALAGGVAALAAAAAASSTTNGNASAPCAAAASALKSAAAALPLGPAEDKAARGGAAGAESTQPQLQPLLSALREFAEAARDATEAGEGEGGGGAGGGAGLWHAGGADGGVARAAEAVGLTLNSLGLVQMKRAGRGDTGRSAGLREARELMEASVQLLELFSAEERGLGAADARANLAGLLLAGGGGGRGTDMQAAEHLLRSNLAAAQGVYGRGPTHTATALNNLARCLKRQRAACPAKGAEAAALYRAALATAGAALGEAHPEALVAATNLAGLLAEQRQLSESERLYTSAVAGLPAQLGPAHPDCLAAHLGLAEVLERRGRLYEAEAMYGITLQYARAAATEAKGGMGDGGCGCGGGVDHGVVLAAAAGGERVRGALAAAGVGAGKGHRGCCVVS